ncbi:MAG: Re/Si-specific NAD(P)(+) transhydrogenase subunit alpha [Acidobacteria bacterium]|nr:Re/Si-specific NAD(P)(+) transhydrogenase subunit alpha [Acidobacteriota bacterium]
MRVAIPKERAPRENRIAAVPASVKTFIDWEWDVAVETGAGVAAGYPDGAFIDTGATIVPNAVTAHDADLVLRVGPPTHDEIALLHAGSVLCGFLDPFVATDLVDALAQQNVTAVAVEAIPRISVAQSMDALSSQQNVAGYAAVLLAADAAPKFLPMLVTAAGTIPPARALVLGVGVAGLQAIATFKRLGAVVHAYDIRPETKEQVESLGAKFVEAPTQAADEGGYATEVDADTAARQQEVLATFVADADVIVTTAQIPGRPAPQLITEEMITPMHPGSVIVDMAASTGGNVAGSRPDEIINVGGVAIYGPTDLPSRVATDASRMYARNLQEIANRMRTDAGITIDLDDDVIGPATITHEGSIVNPRTRSVMGLDEEGS